MSVFVAGGTGAIGTSRTAAPTVAALDNGGPGVYNVVDDDPAPLREWLSLFAEQKGSDE
jgi:2-alkyl-3-oxoalkanoate reductase